MKKAGDLLGKFKDLAKNQPAVVSGAVKKILADDFLIKIPNTSISVRGGVVKIKTAGPAMAEIITQEKEIIKKVNECLGGEFISRIK